MLHGEPFSKIRDGSTPGTVKPVLDAFKAGKPALVHDADDREGETDMMYPARYVTATDVARLRNDAGGLICVAVSDTVAEAFDLPFLAEALDHPTTENHELTYDERSSFSLSVNHRLTVTGITDVDRAQTIASLGRATQDPSEVDFGAEFRAPGHVNLLKAAPSLIDEREGHTELGVALMEAADLEPAVVVCEMLDDNTGHALSTREARRYANQHNIPFIEGSEVMRVVSPSTKF